MVSESPKQDKLMDKIIKDNKDHLLVVFIVLFGFLLRIYQIGKDSFWLDETGVASVIFVNSFSEFVNIVRSHVAAVPLDYLITWIIGQFTVNEGWLRLPSAIWGALSLIIGYSLFCRLTNNKIALIGLLLLTFSPLHVKYSQELRFYSSLIFFYIFSTKLILNALSSKKTKDWVLFTIVTIIGFFFHIYVGLSVINGLLWFFFSDIRRDQKIIRKFSLSLILILTGALSAYYFFAGYNSLLTEPFTKIESLSQAFGVGFGWMPVTQEKNLFFYLWGIICLFMELFGIVFLYRYERNSTLTFLILSIGIQIVIVLFLTVLRGYFIQSRHFIFIYPFLLLICAKGFFEIVERYVLSKFDLGERNKSVLSSILLCGLCILSLPPLFSYFQDNKGFARETAIFLSENWKSGDSIFFFPHPYSAEPVKYYLVNVMENENILPNMWTVNIDQDLDTILNWNNGKIYLIGPTSPELEYKLSQKRFMATEIQDVWVR
jgi:4-amino-4-deoxy-L-arabinose transferase-like glycosyltransferase